MMVQNEIKVQGELANKTDYRTVSYKHQTGRTSATTIHNQFFLTMYTVKQVFSLLTA